MLLTMHSVKSIFSLTTLTLLLLTVFATGCKKDKDNKTPQQQQGLGEFKPVSIELTDAPSSFKIEFANAEASKKSLEDFLKPIVTEPIYNAKIATKVNIIAQLLPTLGNITYAFNANNEFVISNIPAVKDPARGTYSVDGNQVTVKLTTIPNLPATGGAFMNLLLKKEHQYTLDGKKLMSTSDASKIGDFITQFAGTLTPEEQAALTALIATQAPKFASAKLITTLEKK